MIDARLLQRARCGIAVAMVVLAFSGRPAVAEVFPARKITFVVAASAGGYADAVARILAERLGDQLKQSIIVENRGGAGGNIAAKAVLGEPADGYTVLVTTTQLAINETLYRNKGFSTTDLQPVSIPVSAPEVIVANPNNPSRTLAELVKSRIGKPLTYGSAGTGTGSFIEAQYLFEKIAKIKTVHVPFPGGAPAISDLLGDHIHVLAVTVSPVIQLINRGALRGLGIASPSRMTFVPDVPTFAESGFPNYYAASWVGLFVSAKTPQDVVEKLNNGIGAALQDPGVKRRLNPLGVEVVHTTVPKTALFFQSEIARWGKMVRELGISID